MVKLFSCKAHDGDYFWLRYKHDEEKLYHNLVIDGGRKSNASDFYEMLKHICKNGEQIDAMVLTHFDQDHIMGMFAGLQKAQKKNYIPKIAALYLNTGKGYWKHHQSLEGSEPLPEETVKIPMTDAPGYSANDLKKLTDFLQEYGLEEHICSYIVQSCEEIHIGNAKCYIISPSDASLKDLIQNFSDFMQVSPVTPYGGADPEWSKPLDELSGYDTPEDTSLSNGASIATVYKGNIIKNLIMDCQCVAIWKMLRKKGCVPSALTQNVKDFLASPEIENIFENSDFLVLLSQAQGDRQILAKQLGISPHQLSYFYASPEFPYLQGAEKLCIYRRKLSRLPCLTGHDICTEWNGENKHLRCTRMGSYGKDSASF